MTPSLRDARLNPDVWQARLGEVLEQDLDVGAGGGVTAAVSAPSPGEK